MSLVNNLQPPYLVIKMVPNFAGLELPPLQSTFWYGIIEQINFSTLSFAVGDIVMFEKKEANPAFFNNGIEYWVVSEANVFYTAMSTATKIFDFTFDYTFE
jgi:hypothetical protein